jgi:hypothetical protein
MTGADGKSSSFVVMSQHPLQDNGALRTLSFGKFSPRAGRCRIPRFDAMEMLCRNVVTMVPIPGNGRL